MYGYGPTASSTTSYVLASADGLTGATSARSTGSSTGSGSTTG